MILFHGGLKSNITFFFCQLAYYLHNYSNTIKKEISEFEKIYQRMDDWNGVRVKDNIKVGSEIPKSRKN